MLIFILTKIVINSFFFFQAEDGIRDSSVTGVQTCALPISIPKDVEENKVSMTTKLTMPVLAIGAAKMFGANEAIVMRNVADDVAEVLIENSGHWLMDEKPADTIVAVRDFLDRKTAA